MAKNSPVRLAPARYCALLVLSLTVVTGCGLASGQVKSADVPPVQITSSVSAEPVESLPAPAESTPAPALNQAESTPAPAESGGAQTASSAVDPGGTLVDGSTVSAELTRAGQRDKFTLDLGDAREFHVADMEGDGIQFQVFSDVDDQPVGFAGTSLTAGTSLAVKLTKAGGYRLEVWGDPNVIGPYSFRIATVKVRTFPAAIGLKIGEDSPVGAGQLDVPGRIDRFEFDADGAKAIQVIGDACTGIDIELYSATEKSIADPRQPSPLCGNQIDFQLSGGSERYALVVRSPAAKTGTYSFQIVRAG
ncbi:hypothetical protein GCM10023194_05650 [Planotetraspora phitsanulokensis]|uniref:Peptidase C-terminal archaeal/bacterial domain-containing protein n=1 Tax=Planotetraspora phitsanulokensis TaxID=575192 RepID=A0A8J3U911_9ACTN|nr:hypothetical protein [Planotetraspora phitsanulokensis]GII39061.1 hypothetical protein Pph01_40640 [Planotetraspora phitsanulokensis]